jgi:hypothetical protein
MKQPDLNSTKVKKKNDSKVSVGFYWCCLSFSFKQWFSIIYPILYENSTFLLEENGA